VNLGMLFLVFDFASYNFFIHLFFKAHSDRFHTLAVMNNAAVAVRATHTCILYICT
jgi:hypothetical protein